MEIAQKIVCSLKGVLPKSRELPLHEPSLDDLDLESVRQCLESTFVSTVGKHVGEFESKICMFTSSRHAIAVVNGTAALHVALMLAGVKQGDEVLVPSLTFVATANAVRYCGAIPHFIDVEAEGICMDPVRLRTHLKKIGSSSHEGLRNRTTGAIIRAMVPVHIFGHPANLDQLSAISREFGIALVEDAAESLGSLYQGRHTGVFGQSGTLSFNGNKIITTGGGGAILTQDDDLAAKARHLTTTAKLPHPWRYDHDEVGYNYRLPNLNAALGCSQLEKIELFIEAKRKLFSVYQSALADFDDFCVMLREPHESKSNYWLHALVLKKIFKPLFDPLMEELHRNKIYARPAWTPLHLLRPYKACPRMNLGESEEMAGRIINLPSSPQILLS